MKRGTLHVAMVAALLGLAATTAEAGTPDLGPSENTVELRVVNNHAAAVRVYLRDAEGRVHRLGKVGRADFRILEIPGEVAALGAVEIRVFPDEPVWSLVGDDGVKTRGIELELGDAVNLFLETDLEDSQVEIARG